MPRANNLSFIEARNKLYKSTVLWGRILGSNALTGLSVYFITKKRYEKKENLNLQCHSIKDDAASKTFKTYTKIVSNTFDSGYY